MLSYNAFYSSNYSLNEYFRFQTLAKTFPIILLSILF